MERRDLALEAAFTSMSLRERCREPGVVCTLDPTSLPTIPQKKKTLLLVIAVVLFLIYS